MLLIAAGAKDVTMPDIEQARDEFDLALEAAPQKVDQDRQDLLEALGLR